MTSLALRSLAHRRTAFVATFISGLLGATVIGAFATLGAAATGPVSSADRQTLITISGVIGVWGALIVLFAVVSTAGITVRQRREEVALLRTVGASPDQVRSLVRREAGVVLTLGAVIGAVVAAVIGRGILAGIRGLHLVGRDVSLTDAAGGRATVLATVVVAAVLVVAAGVIASGLAVRRVSRDEALHALAGSRGETDKLPRWRWLVAVVCIGHAATMGILAATTHSANPYDAMAYCGSCAIVVAIGMAAVAPALLRWSVRLLRPIVGQDASGFLAATNTSRRAHLLGSVLGPVTVLTAAVTSTLMVVGIDDRTRPAHIAQGDKAVTTLNYVVVAMLAVFAMVSVGNALAATTAARRAEFDRLSVLGADRDVLVRSVVLEARLVSVTGVVLGLIATLFTTIPFGIARGEGVVPDGQLWLPPLVVVGVLALTDLAARASVARLGMSRRRTGSAAYAGAR